MSSAGFGQEWCLVGEGIFPLVSFKVRLCVDGVSVQSFVRLHNPQLDTDGHLDLLNLSSLISGDSWELTVISHNPHQR